MQAYAEAAQHISDQQIAMQMQQQEIAWSRQRGVASAWDTPYRGGPVTCQPGGRSQAMSIDASRRH